MPDVEREIGGGFAGGGGGNAYYFTSTVEKRRACGAGRELNGGLDVIAAISVARDGAFNDSVGRAARITDDVTLVADPRLGSGQPHCGERLTYAWTDAKRDVIALGTTQEYLTDHELAPRGVFHRDANGVYLAVRIGQQLEVG
jgi:hypothetical protein